MVIDHDSSWSDTKRKQRGKLWMPRLKSFDPKGINKPNAIGHDEYRLLDYELDRVLNTIAMLSF